MLSAEGKTGDGREAFVKDKRLRSITVGGGGGVGRVGGTLDNGDENDDDEWQIFRFCCFSPVNGGPRGRHFSPLLLQILQLQSCSLRRFRWRGVSGSSGQGKPCPYGMIPPSIIEQLIYEVKGGAFEDSNPACRL
jgi:hypothetical protein